MRKPKTQHRRPDRAPVTMETIAAKCDEVGDCLIWKGATNSRGVPSMSVDGRPISVRLWIARNVLQLDLSGGLIVTCSCLDQRCVAQGHVIGVKRAVVQKMWSDHLQYSTHPARRAKLAAAARKRSKNSPELIQKIRDAEGRQIDIAQRLGVSQHLVSRVKRRRIWNDYAGNPWLGLLPAGRNAA